MVRHVWRSSDGEFSIESVEGNTDLGDAAAEPVATSEEQPSEIQPAIDNEDVFPADEHEQTEEVKEVLVEDADAIEVEIQKLQVKIAELKAKKSKLSEGIEGETDLGDAAHVENEATEESAPAEEAPELTNDDSHPADEHQQAEEVKEVIVKQLNILH